MSLILLGAQSGLPASVARAQSTPGEATALDLGLPADEFEKLFTALEQAIADIPRDTFDPAAIVEVVGHEPAMLFEWVRDETHMVPYRGVLRGHTGVLMDRLGNSLDRALLLYALLRQAGHEVRLARGALSGAEAAGLFEGARASPPRDAPATAAASEAHLRMLMDRYVREFDLDEALWREQLDRALQERQHPAKDIATRVAEQTAFIAAAVGLPLGDAEAEIRAAQIEALRDHWWVQSWNGATWIDLDASLPTMERGQKLVGATATLQPDRLSDLGEDLLHRVQIRVVVECLTEGVLQETQVLESPGLIPAELFGEQIVLRHVPTRWPQDLNTLADDDLRQRLRDTVLGQELWAPFLSVGTAVFADLSVTDSCEFGDATQPPTAISELGRGIGGMLGGGGIGGLGQTRSEVTSRLTAEWIEYEVHVPGHEVRTIRRQVFDLVGPAARAVGTALNRDLPEADRLERGLALMSETEILLQASRLSPQFLEYQIASGLLANREFVINLARNQGSIDARSLHDQLGAVTPLPGPLSTLALARTEWSQVQEHVFLDRPSILSHRQRIKDGPDRQLLHYRGYDIVTNDIAVHAGADVHPFLVRLEQGVLDTNAEAILFTGHETIENVAEMSMNPRDQHDQWLTVRDVDDPHWHEAAIPSDLRTRIEQDLADGYVIIVPHPPVGLERRTAGGWWRIDPRSGQVLGIGENGAGQAGTETRLQENQTLALHHAAKTYIGTVFCIVGAGLGESSTVAVGLALCMLGTVSSHSAMALLLTDSAAAVTWIGYLTLVLLGAGGTASLWAAP